LTEEQFKKLDFSGVFSGLNDIIGSCIDDFEDESIKNGEQLGIGLIYLKKIYTKDDITANLIEKIIFIFQEALSRKTGVYFYF